MDVYHKNIISHSEFRNTYGGLDLIEKDGQKYLMMEDCFGPDYFGPLTEEQINAFNVLCKVPKILLKRY
ncbi:MAG TPA: hypothetical protein VFM18_16350 [Methanosarcina sp.]|nr:hypothetical protein [Methanosarcina sp.]